MPHIANNLQVCVQLMHMVTTFFASHRRSGAITVLHAITLGLVDQVSGANSYREGVHITTRL